MKLITVHVSEWDLQKLDQLIPEYYANRAEAIRIAIHDLLAINHCKTLKRGKN